MEREFVECIKDVQGMRFQFVSKETAEGASSSSQRFVQEMANMLNIDGDLIHLPESQYEVR
jgi:hypothetical protein